MNIVYIITRADTIGGAQTHVRDLSLAMLQKGHHVTVITGNGELYKEHLESFHIPVKVIRSLSREPSIYKDMRTALELYNSLKDIRPDLVTLHSSKAGLIGRIVCFFLNIPTIFTVHGWSFADGVPKKKAIVFQIMEKLLSLLPCHIICVSNQDKNLAIKHRITQERKMTVIHNGVHDLKRSNFGIYKEPLKFISVARMAEQKDHAMLIDVLKDFKEQKWQLNLVGDGPLQNELERMIATLKMEDKVNFLGFRSDVNRLLMESDLFILISNWEGLPISIIEAMSAGIPIIASDVGGVSECVVDRENGFLIGRKDHDGLRDIFKIIFEGEVDFVKISDACRSKYKEHYTFDAQLGKTIFVYEKFLEEFGLERR